MSYRFKVKEPLADGVRRVALDQIEIADKELRGNADGAAAIHNARRCLKRLRALLRLIRPGLTDGMYKREAARLAETGRLLAGERDRHVMRQTLRKLEGSYGALPEEMQAQFEALLAQPHVKGDAPPDQARRKAMSKLAGARKFFAGHAIENVGISDVFDGVERVYRKARRMHRQCMREASDEDFHTWRKSVQQHWRHMQLLSRAWPEALGARAFEAKRLSQLLGEDHDLHVLASFARAHADALPPAGLTALKTHARESQEHLRAMARLYGERLFAERADDLIERLGSYWSAARRLSETAASVKEPESPAETPPRPQTLRPLVESGARSIPASTTSRRPRRKVTG